MKSSRRHLLFAGFLQGKPLKGHWRQENEQWMTFTLSVEMKNALIDLLILEGWIGGRRNHAFWYCVTSTTLNKPNIFLGSQITIEDFPFPPLVPRMNSCTSVLQGKINILCHSLAAKRPCQCLRVNNQIKAPWW